MKITRGKIAAPVRAVIYGPEGVGKSTFASSWPSPVFLDVEGGTKQLDVARIEPITTADELRRAVAQLATEDHDFRTVVVDTADWLERKITDDVCRKGKVENIEGFGYGKGYTILAESIAGFLRSLDDLQAKRGMHVVLLAHATTKRCDPPTESGQPFDRYELKCTKQVSPLLKEWADLLLFLNFKTTVVEGQSGKSKGLGGRERCMYTTHHAAYDAKNRFGLPDELPVSVAALASIFAAPVSAPTKGETPAEPVSEARRIGNAIVAAQTPSAPVTPTAPDAKPNDLRTLLELSGIPDDKLIGYLLAKSRIPAACAVDAIPAELAARIVASWDKASAAVKEWINEQPKEN